MIFKVKNILEGCLDLIPSHSSSVKIAKGHKSVLADLSASTH